MTIWITLKLSMFNLNPQAIYGEEVTGEEVKSKNGVLAITFFPFHNPQSTIHNPQLV
ncbi:MULTISPECIES: hypothetical protein [Cyanophyceae]|jgi:hypothetical protein|uniref:hypothetical protein n=1 Tax=Cyanophyceae TaxID=3028117 RepID=UPI001687DC35|nr:hypothetical protein [Trichocoleus sp. FACHB-40]MBD2006256.1 hypothetical protein [Trichocoleus sp. FACHB-40]